MAYDRKSGHMRRKSVRTPGGRTKIHYSRFKADVPKCGVCGIPLNGVVGSCKSMRSVERLYGGYLCHSCLEMLLKLSVRA